MIKWRSLLFFILTIVIILGSVTGMGWYGYNMVLGKFASLHPEINVTPSGVAVYRCNEKVLKSYVEHKEKGYSIMLPPNYVCIEKRGDPSIYLRDKNDNWEIVIREKMLRYEDSLRSKQYPVNPEGDYYVLLKDIYNATKNPILLFQKLAYLPSSTVAIKEVVTPNFRGFYVVAGTGDRRVEFYNLFDKYYWHNVMVVIYNSNYPHWKIENILATLKNSDIDAKWE